MKFRSAIVVFSLILGLFSTQLSAQSAAKSYQGWYEGLFMTEVYCDGIMVDYVEGVLNIHAVQHSYDGMTVAWDIYQAKGMAESTYTGEKFVYKEMDKITRVDGAWDMYEWHYHLKGNKGHHYMGKVLWNVSTGEVTVGPTTCK